MKARICLLGLALVCSACAAPSLRYKTEINRLTAAERFEAAREAATAAESAGNREGAEEMLRFLTGETDSESHRDEGHFLLVFCDDGNGSYNCGFVSGLQAQTVMDSEAVAILADYLDRYYSDYSISEEEVFSKTFEATGERIMTVTRSPLPVVAVCAAVVVVAVLVFLTLKKRREQREREQQRVETILKTPLETFGDQDVEDLADKYEDPDGKT